MNCPYRITLQDFPYFVCKIDGEVHYCNDNFNCELKNKNNNEII